MAKLNGRPWLDSQPVSRSARFLHAPRCMIGGTNASHRPAGDEVSERCHRFGERNAAILRVRPQQVDRFHSQPVKAACHRGDDRVRREAFCGLWPPVRHERILPNLGCDAHSLADAVVRTQPPSDYPLACPSDTAGIIPERVAVGSIEPHPARRHESIHQGERAILIDRRSVGHRAQNQSGHRRFVVHATHALTWSALQVKR